MASESCEETEPVLPAPSLCGGFIRQACCSVVALGGHRGGAGVRFIRKSAMRLIPYDGPTFPEKQLNEQIWVFNTVKAVSREQLVWLHERISFLIKYHSPLQAHIT